MSLLNKILFHWYRGHILSGLLANPQRYKYISKCVKNGMSQEEATQKNLNKATIMTEQLLKEKEVKE